MNKLRLHLEDISVESFSTLPASVRLGTVDGHQMSQTTCQQIICDCTDPTNNATCPGTCANSCNGTCDASCNGTCNGCPSGSTCDASCGLTCGVSCDYTCQGQSCEYCTEFGQIICG
jgi:hypothetical protein